MSSARWRPSPDRRCRRRARSSRVSTLVDARTPRRPVGPRADRPAERAHQRARERLGSRAEHRRRGLDGHEGAARVRTRTAIQHWMRSPSSMISARTTCPATKVSMLERTREAGWPRRSATGCRRRGVRRCLSVRMRPNLAHEQASRESRAGITRRRRAYEEFEPRHSGAQGTRRADRSRGRAGRATMVQT